MYNLGLALQHQNKNNEAQLVYSKGLESMPYSTTIKNALAILYIQSGDKEKGNATG